MSEFKDTKKVFFNMFTDEIVCPYCGYEFEDSWEYDDDEDVECYHCEKKFHVTKNVEVTYETHRINEDGKVDYDDELIGEEYEA